MLCRHENMKSLYASKREFTFLTERYSNRKAHWFDAVCILCFIVITKNIFIRKSALYITKNFEHRLANFIFRRRYLRRYENKNLVQCLSLETEFRDLEM